MITTQARIVGIVMMVIGLGFILGSSMGSFSRLVFFVLDAVGLVFFLVGHQVWAHGRHH